MTEAARAHFSTDCLSRDVMVTIEPTVGLFSLGRLVLSRRIIDILVPVSEKQRGVRNGVVLLTGLTLSEPNIRISIQGCMAK
mmetsp:Transcript_3337/g.10177  ORF Transcript_3337/g.10177 Transcript_3337/m.10177 type:complete len:82 (+) Transcript_3337:532-777(+)